MVLMHFLRALADLGFYYSIAGILSTLAGGRLTPALLLVQSGCFALSSALRRSRVARTAALIPALLALVLPAAPADRLASLPPALYLAYLAWTDNYQLSWSRQAGQLSLFCKVFPAAALGLSMAGFWRPVFSAGLPLALLTAAASVLLTRSLRHDPEVYLQPGYQLVNFASVALLTLAALALGSPWALRAASFLAGAVYNGLIAPVLLGISVLIGTLLLWIVPLVRWLFSRSSVEGQEQSLELDLETPMQRQLEELQESLPAAPSRMLTWLAVTAAVLAAAAATVLLFRWMARRRCDGEPGTAPLRADVPQRESAPAQPGTYAYRVRRQYRAFLRLCGRRGLAFALSDTSTDVGRRALDVFPEEEALAALRDIYQRARYQGRASREDYQRCKRLLGVLKKADGGVP